MKRFVVRAVDNGESLVDRGGLRQGRQRTWGVYDRKLARYVGDYDTRIAARTAADELTLFESAEEAKL